MSELSAGTANCAGLTLLVLFVVIAPLTGPSPAYAQQFQWQSSTVDAVGGRMPTLWQGVPETDNVAFSATCPQGTGGQAEVVLGYNTGTVTPNTPITLELVIDGQVVHRMTGVTYSPVTEEGLHGIFVRADLNDSLWSILSANSYLRYQAANLGLAGMNLSGSSGPIQSFLSDCRTAYAQAVPPQQTPRGGPAPLIRPVKPDYDNPENQPGPSAKSCRHLGSIKSKNTGIPVTIRFENASSGYRSVMWINYEGQPVEYKNLNPGEAYDQQTAVEHPWMITDGPGNCKAIFIPRQNSRRYVIVD